MTSPRSGGRSPSRARPRTPPRHGTGRRSWRSPRGVGRGFGHVALAAGVAVGLAGGAAAGTAVGRAGVDATVTTAGVSLTWLADGLPARGAFERLDGGIAAAAPSATAPADDASATAPTGAPAGAVDAPPDGPPPTSAAPAAPAAIDPGAVDLAGLTFADREAGLLSAVVPDGLGGDLVVVPGNDAAPAPDRHVRTVRVEVEAGLDVDGALFAATVMAVLNDPRGWGGDGSVSFARTDGDAEIRVVLASPETVDVLCAPLQTVGRYSCGRAGRAVLNYDRWVNAAPEFADRTVYRQYLVNHEVGHLLGQPHVQCPGPGEVAPIMQQQTVGVAPCVPNGWPFPDAG